MITLDGINLQFVKGIMSKQEKIETEFSKALELFKKKAETARDKISEQIIIASVALAKAEEISEQYGIPFSSDVSPISQSYLPESFSERWSSLSQNCFEQSLTEKSRKEIIATQRKCEDELNLGRPEYERYNKRANEIIRDEWRNIMDECKDGSIYEGWQHSAVC